MPSLPGLSQDGLTSLLREAGDMKAIENGAPGKAKKPGSDSLKPTQTISPLKAAESLNDKLLKEFNNKFNYISQIAHNYNFVDFPELQLHHHPHSMMQTLSECTFRDA
jgi:hypothetical protein